MARCPFYGCRWPERSPKLERVGGSECGLDVDGYGGPCEMEVEGRAVDYFCCPLVEQRHRFLAACEHLVILPVEGKDMTLQEWQDENRW